MNNYLVPLAGWVASRKQGKPLVIGINGAQGSGKSTITAVLAIILKQNFGYNVATLSIDDLYLTRSDRLKLAEAIHPLFKTRGVPGTHDIGLGIETIHKLIAEDGEVSLSRFDKSIDDRLPEKLWPRCNAPVDVVLFEGWCVATPAQSKDDLLTATNELEAIEDREGVWRAYVNQVLAGSYRQLFSMIDAVVFLKAPGFDSVLQWRSRQEAKTFRTHQEEGMNSQQLKRFIQHYERLTRVSLDNLPELADVVLELDDAQRIVRSEYKS
ncbi:hypothetical protein [Mariprofundus aestuarium]|uniref:hypothetical protein n=1 Tax=Mariprofundus aestuarium TaxID=1921086 RepID=UPI001E619A43|nr:hypothetical protein [Mariprofundus aestuarium]